MNRREFIIAIVALGAAAGPITAVAQQQGKVWRVGFLSSVSASISSQNTDAFIKGMRELGYVEGKNIVIEWRYAEGKPDRLPALAAELVRLWVDVIVTGGPVPTRAAKETLLRSPLSWRRIAILLAAASSLVWRALEETSLDWQACPGAKRKAVGASEGDRS